MTYAIIKVAGKQYRVREGERLLVDRLHQDEGATFAPTVLLVGGDGAAKLDPGDGVVTAKVLGDTKGPKIRIGKYKKRTGYRRHNGLPGIAHADPDRVDRGRQAGALELRRRRPRVSRRRRRPEVTSSSRRRSPGGLRGHDDRGDQGGFVRCGTRPRSPPRSRTSRSTASARARWRRSSRRLREQGGES